MGTPPKLPYIEDLVSWLGIAWIIAFLAGLWGAMLGIGKFGLSEFLFLLCGAIILGKVAVETMRDRTRSRFVALILVLLAVASLEFYVMHWTNGLAVEASQQQDRLKKLDDIPGLQSQLQALKQQQIIDAATSKQQVSDIGQDNKDLKGSIEKKDAILAAIAKEQLDLNYAPEVTITTNDTKDTIFVMNNGKTNVVLYGFDIDMMSVGGEKIPQTIAPTTSTRFSAGEQTEKNILATAQQENLATVSHDGTAYLRTQNKRSYSLGFSINYAIKDGAITKVFVVDHSIVEITKPQ
jgi:cell division protein FtsB